MKAEPQPTNDVNRASGTDSANGCWLRRLVRRLGYLSLLFATPVFIHALAHFWLGARRPAKYWSRLAIGILKRRNSRLQKRVSFLEFRYGFLVIIHILILYYRKPPNEKS